MPIVRWGVVGAGRIAHTFAVDMRLVANAEIKAVAARRLAPAVEFAGRHDIATAYEGYDRLYADPDIDAVYVATPHSLHLQHSGDALRAGKAVLCEKPLTTSAAECEALMQVAAETGGYLMEAMWTWFLPAIRTAREWVRAGRIGELRHLRSELGYPKEYDPRSRLFDPALGGGCLLDMGIYPVAMAYYFLGKSPRDVQVVSRHAPNGVDEDVSMQFDYGDAVASLATSFRCKLPNVTCLIGSDGYITIPHGWSARECHLFRMHDCVDSFTDEREGSGFEFEIAAVSNDILQGRRQSPVLPLDASLAFQKDMDRVRRHFPAAAR